MKGEILYVIIITNTVFTKIKDYCYLYFFVKV